MTLKELYEKIKEKVKPGELLKLDKDSIPGKIFAKLIDLLNQKSLELGGPDIDFDKDEKVLTISGSVDIFGTSSGDFKLEISKADDFIFKVTATLNSLSIEGMAQYNLVNDDAPDLDKLPPSPFEAITLTATAGGKEGVKLGLAATMKDQNWNILGLPMFKLKDFGFELSTTKPKDEERDTTLGITGVFKLGSKEIDAAVNIPLNSSAELPTWTFNFAPAKAIDIAFTDLTDLLFSNSLQNCVPQEMLGKGPLLKTLAIDFAVAKASVNSVAIKLAVDSEMKVGDITLKKADINLNLEREDQKSPLKLGADFDVEMAFSEKDIKLNLKVPSVSGDWTLATSAKTGTPKLKDINDVATVPGSAPASEFKLPDGLKKAADGLVLKDFSSVFNPSAKSWKQVTIDVSYDKSWDLIPGVLKVNAMSFKLDAKKTTKAKTTTTTTSGSFETKLRAGGEGDKGFEMTLNATKKAADWTYKATTGKIKLNKIIESLLGELSFVPDIEVGSFELSIDQTKKTYTGSAKVGATWSPIDILELEANFIAKITSDRSKAEAVNVGTIEGIVGIKNISAFKNAKLKVVYNFKNGNIEAEFLGAKTTYNKDTNIATFNLGAISLGSMITKMIGWIEPNSSITLEDPWTILNDINLKDLNFKFNLKDKSFGFEYKPGSGLNLGIATLNGISLNYVKDDKGKYQLKMKLDGQLLGKDIPAWDVMKPGTAPKVPGGGDSKFDLEYLAMGQRVSLKDTSDIHKMDQALNALQTAFEQPEQSDKVPINANSKIAFDSNSNWLIGAKFTIMNTVELGVIFNDPKLYGLLVRLKGEKAKMFKGLEFEIIYKKISDTIGVYEIELKLPDAMRNLEFGAVSVTLPVIGLQVYTNGNFRIDIGFPWNGDFTRSFTVQAFPFIGSGGFYFAWLSAETATSVPAITSGNFNPVIEFGIGLSLGLGKTFEKGILSGGLSLQVRGILQGVIGFYNPNPDPVTGAIVKSDANYYAVQGALEIVGRLYGNINFGIVKASLDITVHVLAKVIFISYEPIDIYLEAGISVRLTIEIDLGLFSINIHFSFDATVKEHFQVGEHVSPPWRLAQKQSAGMLRSRHKQLFKSSTRYAEPPKMEWQPLTFTSQPTVNIFFVPSLTVAAKKTAAQPDEPGKQTSRYMTMLYIETPNPNSNDDANTSFTTLAQNLLVWTINANQTDNKGWTGNSYDDIITKPVTLNYLQNCYDYFTKVTGANIPLEAINSFLTAFDVRLNHHEANNGQELHGSIFPMFPLLTLKSSLNGVELGNEVDFETFTPVNEAYRRNINDYFQKTAVDYQNSLEAAHNRRKVYKNEILHLDAPTPSMAAVIYQDYFVMMAKASLGEAIELMKAFPYAYQNESLVKMAALFGVHEEAILLSNQSVPLAGDLALKIRGGYFETGGESLNTLADEFDVPVARIIGFNRLTAGIIETGKEIIFGDKKLTTDTDSTLQKIAGYFKVPESHNQVADLVANTNIATIEGLFKHGSKLLITPLTYETREGDSVVSIISNYRAQGAAADINLKSFCELNAITDNLFIAGQDIFIKPDFKITIEASDTILSLAQRSTEGNIDVLIDLVAKSNQTLPLKPQNTVFIPDFTFTVNKATAVADTLENILNRFSLTADAFLAANDRLENIWETSQEITLPNINAINIGELNRQLAAHNKFKNLSGMAARFLLHGLRLPDHAQLKAVKLLKDLKSEPQLLTHSLYDLTGQGLDLPELKTGDQFSIILQKNESASFINFHAKKLNTQNGKALLLDVDPGDRLVVELTPNDLVKVNQLAKTVLDPKVPVLQGMQPYVETSKKFNFSNFTQWTYGSPKPMWASQQAGVTPTIWQMPSNLLQEAFASQKILKPLVKLVTAKQDVPNTPVKMQDVENYGWSLSVPLTISKVAGFSSADENAATPNMYQVIGTDEVSMMFLERLIRFCKTKEDEKILDKVHILYPPNPADNKSGSLISNDPNHVTSFIVKTNFSTESNPLRLLRASGEPVKIQSNPKQFAEMVWQASVVKSGGFYLYYAFNDKDELPANLFTNGDKAEIRLLFTFNNSIVNNTIHDFMNSVAIGENINAANTMLCALSEEQVIGNVSFGADDAISTIADRYRVSVDDLGNTLKELKINGANKEVVILSGLVYEVKQGDTFADIAIRFGRAQERNFDELIRTANPALTDKNYATAWTLVNMPELKIIPGTITGISDSIDAIAKYYHISISQATHLVKDIKGLFIAGHSFTISDHLTERNAIMQPGTIGVELQRVKPGAKTDGDYAQYLESAFNLLGIKIAPNNYFKESNEGLPAGFNDSEKPKQKRLPKGISADDIWNFKRVLPVASYASYNSMKGSGALPGLIETNPYAGIGGSVQIHMNWQDVFGNRTIDPFSSPARFSDKTGGALNQVPIKVAYTDQLISIEKWPGFSANYIYNKPGTDALLSVVFAFDASKYTVFYPVHPNDPADPADPTGKTQEDKFNDDKTTILNKVKADHQIYQNIYYQIWQADISISLEDSLSNTKWVLDAGQLTQVRTMVDAIYQYLGSLIGSQLSYTYYDVKVKDVDKNTFATATKIATAKNVNVNDLILINQGLEHPFLKSDKLDIIIPAPIPAALVLSKIGADVNTSQIFELTVGATIARSKNLVDEAFIDVDGVGSITSALKPLSTSLKYAEGHFDEKMDDEDGKKLSLAGFAASFESTYSNCKIATGTSINNLITNQKEKQLWIVRWQGDKGINVNIGGEPVYFSTAPLANYLLNYSGDKAISVKPFDPSKGLVDAGAALKNYAAINLDEWGNRFLDAVDNFLLPQYAIPAYVIDQNTGNESLKKIQDAKQVLAGAIASGSATDKLYSKLTNILANPADYSQHDLDTAAEKLRQLLLVKLGNAYTTDTVVLFKAEVKSQYSKSADFIPPNIYGQPLVPGKSSDDQLYSMSTAKVSLNNGPSDLAFVFSTQNREANKSMELELAYQVTHIEYDIKPIHVLSPDAGAKEADYNASTWLSFVIPPAVSKVMVKPDSSKVNIPIPLKVYPAPPSVTAQTGNHSDFGSSALQLADLLLWDYEYVYQQMESKQDLITTKVQFNIEPENKLYRNSLPESEMLFANLAQFIEVYAEVERVLNDSLIAVTPLSKTEDMAKAVVAVKALADMVTLVANSWKAWRKPGQALFKQNATAATYTVDETELKNDEEKGKALLLKVEKISGSEILPLVEIDGFERESLQGGYIFKYKDQQQGTWLKYADRSKYGQRKLKFERQNILTHQNAWASLSKVRNEKLVDGNSTTLPFIYRTPDVRFTNMMVPYLDTINYENYKPVNIADIENPAAGARALNSLLSNLFKALFKNAAAINYLQTIKMEVSYSYTLGEDAQSPAIVLPICLVPPTGINLNTDFDISGCVNGGAGTSFVCQLSNYIHSWYNNGLPVTTNAKFLVDVSVYSSVSKDNNLPLLRIRDMFLELKSISDM
jgi:hypothetical protein